MEKIRNLWPKINTVQWLILYSHQDYDVLMNGNYCAESKNVEIPVDQIGKYTKNELFERKNSHTQFLRRTSRH